MDLRIEPGRTRIGWVGTGVMGAAMCGRLLDAGYAATVSNRTRAKAEPLAAKGARVVASPAEVAAASDVVFTIVGHPRDVREVYLGVDGVLTAARPGSVVVDMTTSEPALAAEIAEQAASKSVRALDAPVSGGDVGAREGRLSIMIGGDEEAAEGLRPLFEVLGRTIVRHGPAGSGSTPRWRTRC